MTQRRAQRQQAPVAELLEQGATVAVLARRLECSRQALRHWIVQHGCRELRVTASHQGKQDLSELTMENKRLRGERDTLMSALNKFLGAISEVRGPPTITHQCETRLNSSPESNDDVTTWLRGLA